MTSLLRVAALVLVQEQPKQQEEFTPIDQLPPQDQLPAAPLLVGAYAFVLLMLFGYMLMVSRRLSVIQREVDRIYDDFKSRVADGRKRDTVYIDSIAQGRVWTGERAIGIGLVDKIGGIENAIRAAANLARIKEYNIREYPEPKSPFDMLFSSFSNLNKTKVLSEELGEENYRLYQKMKQLKENMGIIQARIPFEWKWN